MKSKGTYAVTNLIMGALCVIFVILVWLTWRDFRNAENQFIWSEDSLVSYIQRENYAGMLRSAYNNEMKEAASTDTMKECYAVAFYYEAAALYKTYEETGRYEEAEKQKAVMTEQEELMGELAFLAEEIKEELGIAEE